MGILKQAAVVCVCLVVISRVSRLFEEKLPPNYGGFSHPDFQRVADVFRANIESGKEPGGALAVYYKGELVLDLWGGYADLEAQRMWNNDTTTLVFSCTKGVAAIVVAKMVQDGILDYQKPVSDYWPEFAHGGKDNITVEMLISHQAGLVGLDEPLSINDFKADPEMVRNRLATQTPAWPAGTQFGYHAMTFGLYVDQLIQHADPAGRDTKTVFQEDIAKPHDIDFQMSLSLEDFHRTARLYPRTRYGLLMDAMTYRRYLTPMYQIVFKPESLMAKSVGVISEFIKSTATLNNPKFREITISSLSGTGTARGLGKLYAIIANGGELNGKRILTEEFVKRLSNPVVTGNDYVMLTGEDTSIGPGTLFRRNPKGEETVGHTGHGGQVAIADVTNDLGIAYVSNHLSIHGIGDDPRYVDYETTLYECLDDIKNRNNG